MLCALEKSKRGSLPLMLQRSRRVGASPEYWLIMPLLAAWGTGMVRVMGLWNFLRRGSTVTIGDTATPLPRSLATSSAGIGCAWKIFIWLYSF